jgi:hypothetical protein
MLLAADNDPVQAFATDRPNQALEPEGAKACATARGASSDQVQQVLHRAFIARFGPSRQADGICDSERHAHSAASGDAGLGKGKSTQAARRLGTALEIRLLPSRSVFSRNSMPQE